MTYTVYETDPCPTCGHPVFRGYRPGETQYHVLAGEELAASVRAAEGCAVEDCPKCPLIRRKDR